MHFFHSTEIRSAFPALTVGVLRANQLEGDLDFDEQIGIHVRKARDRLLRDAKGSQVPVQEGQWPEIQAWRRVYASMGFQPTQVRCAAEALLRRLRQEGQLPRVHPLVDLCNAASARAAVPIAVFDCDRIRWPLCVRHAAGEEVFETFSGEVERPAKGEVIFADAGERAHSRRWAHRQSRFSAVSTSTTSVLIVLEAFHAGSAETIREALGWLDDALRQVPGCHIEWRLGSASDAQVGAPWGR